MSSGVFVFYGELPFSNWGHRSVLDLLHPKEVKKILGYRRKVDQDLSMLGKFLLLYGLNKIGVGITDLKKMCNTKYGRPYFPFENQRNMPVFDFNISHSGNISVVAIGLNVRTGIDIEENKSLNPSDYFSVFDEQEKLWIGADACRLLRLWTRKEAMIKYHGNGFSLDARTNPVLNDTVEVDNQLCHFKDLVLDKNYVCSLATDCKEVTVHLERIN